MRCSDESGAVPRIPRRPGFTLIELLVVITIIGTLMGLLIPTINAARELGRQAVCRNNLANIGKALQQYEQVRQCLPYGGRSYWDPNITVPHGGDSDLPRRGYGSLLFFLLPFLDNETLYGNMMNNVVSGHVAWPTILAGTNNTTATLIKIEAYQANGKNPPMPLFVCPSDDLRGVCNGSPSTMRGQGALTCYAGSSGPRDVNGVCPNKFSSYMYAGMSKTANTRYLGPFLYSGKDNSYAYGSWGPTRLEMIHDGLSNTIFVGEVRPYCTSAAYDYGWASSDNGCGKMSTEVPINYNTCTGSAAVAANNPDPCGRYDSCMSLGFKSRHPGGAMFLMGDNSVDFFKDTLDHTTYQYLGAIDDGNAATIPGP
jgi:prepilin-type N-terminal cleavage/methylation domain-containing protein